MTRYVHATESRMHRGTGGEIRSVNSADLRETFAPWFEVFDEVVVVARVAARVGDDGTPVERADFTVHPIPDYIGPVQLAARFRSVRSAVRGACGDPSSFYGGRLPGVMSTLVSANARRVGAPFFAHVVGDPEAVLKTGVGGAVGKLASRWSRTVLRRQVARAQAVLYVSDYYLQDKYPASPGVATIARSNVAMPDEAVVDRPARPRESGTVALVAVGTHERLYKGHDLLIRAVRPLASRGLDVRLELVGGGRMQQALRVLARQCDVEDRVVFHGHVDEPAAVRGIIDDADIFVMPSRTEGVPRALIEAMARGKPCLGSDAGGIPELLGPDALFRADDLDALVDAVARAATDTRWLAGQAETNLAKARAIAASGRDELFVSLLRDFSRTGGSR